MLNLGELGIFTHIDRALVVQDAKIFNDVPLKTDKCFTVLSKLLYLLYQGETLSTQEATAVFFAVTKAFQSKDVPHLCLMRVHQTYLFSLTYAVWFIWLLRNFRGRLRMSSWSLAASLKILTHCHNTEPLPCEHWEQLWTLLLFLV